MKVVVPRKEFLSLQYKVDQILAAMKSSQPQPEDFPRPQSLIDRVEHLEARERLFVEHISLKVEMGIRALDNTRKADHHQFIAIAEKLISEVSTIKSDLQSIITDQPAQSRKLVEETHNAYESTISVLQSTQIFIHQFLWSINSQPH